MNVDDNVNKESAELINQRQDGNNKRVKEPGSLDEDELKNNGIAENVKDRREGALRSPSILQVSQQQPQGTMVCWERFLHLRSLKVLLVEKDDCTRHVVAALLRNCSYDVIDAANGLQAWKILDDASYRIDLVLTEVAMPFLSGIGLLSKIMNHKTRHNVPVIMMSSHDSMGLVFKCLSKGAVDFLVKPIRKNELKNLWQHVWRRCHSSSGSGSESGTQTQKSVKSKSAEKSDDNTGSNDEDENESIDLNVGDGSDDGSGTQSSWTKQVGEAESPKPIALRDQIVECPDSTCAQVIHSNAETSVIKQVPVTSTRECQGQEQQLDHVLMGKELEISTPEGMNLQVEFPNQVTKNNVMEMGHGQFNEHIDNVEDGLNIESQSPDLTCVATNTTNPQMDPPGLEAPNRLLNISCTNHTAIAVGKELPSLEFSLKRVRGVKGAETIVREERNVLRRSDSSAFSRYNTASNSNKASSEKLGKSVPLDNSIGVLVTESVLQNVQFHSNNDPPNQFSNGGSNNIDMGSTTNKAFKKPLVSKLKSMASSSVKCLSPSSAFQPLKSDLPCSSQLSKLNKSGDKVAATAQPRDLHQEVQVQHIHHHYSHFLVHSMQQQQQQQLPSDHDELSLKKMATNVPHCGSSNVLSGMLEGNVGNSSFYGSVSGSNFGSNGHNGSSAAVNAGGTNVESDNGIPGKSGSGDASGSGNENRVYQNKLKQREAALTKFRLKRKERCFRKKVRYQSRKKLAEQRPRVRGQFVRQKSNDNTSQTSDT